LLPEGYNNFWEMTGEPLLLILKKVKRIWKCFG
jgi:hypothetical protein